MNKKEYMQNIDLISVIVPVYNVEKYLKKCIESLCVQTYKNLEIILIDDGSTDSSPEICDYYAMKYDCIKVIHKENGGLSDARNVGIENANGDFIAFLDSDDYVSSQIYEVLHRALITSNANMSICNLNKVDEQGKLIIPKTRTLKDEVLSSVDVLDRLQKADGWFYSVAWNKLYKKSLFDDVRFPKNKIHEDEFVAHELIQLAGTVATVSDAHYYYLSRNNSIMSNLNFKTEADLIEALCNRYDFFEEKGYSNLLPEMAIFLKKRFVQFRKYLNGLSNIEKTYARKAIRRIIRIFLKEQIATYEDYIYWLLPLKAECVLAYAECVQLLYALNKSRGRHIIFIDTPTHGNLGDHAIAVAQKQYMQTLIPSLRIIEITADFFDRHYKFLAKVISSRDLIIIPGGGFLGSVWPNEEKRFIEILKIFNRNKIIVFPQTVTFNLDTDEERSFFASSKNIYTSHKDLCICVREEQSYSFMKNHMPGVECRLVPDVALNLHLDIDAKPRKGAMLCMRTDKEKSITEEAYNEIYSKLSVRFGQDNINTYDTVLRRTILPVERELVLRDKLEQFASVKLVVTDRLHGMIFAALTGTPCIAMGNTTGKVKGVYKWLSNFEYVHYVENVEGFFSLFDKLDLEKEYVYDINFLKEHYKPLEELLKG